MAKREPSEQRLLRVVLDLPNRVAAWKREKGVCQRCSGMTGIYIRTDTLGSSTFVRCPECKGTGNATRETDIGPMRALRTAVGKWKPEAGSGGDASEATP